MDREHEFFGEAVAEAAPWPDLVPAAPVMQPPIGDLVAGDLPPAVQDFIAAIIAAGLIRPGRSEREVDHDIYALAQQLYGIDHHWHQRIALAGRNTTADTTLSLPVLRLASQDMVTLDFGPVLEIWGIDIGVSFMLGDAARGQWLHRDLARIHQNLRQAYFDKPDITGAGLHAIAVQAAHDSGWQLGGRHVGHQAGEFPHLHVPWLPQRHRICAENPDRLRQPDALGRPRRWVLRLHLIDPVSGIGAVAKSMLAQA
ncbi:M24 family metallopeptidase [Ferrovibrio sp.]|uniref:M24 family metallopeptidase n=1 Tax=Ferrovibrio sp. TaxID=1917215 RepID=UPI003D1500CF